MKYSTELWISSLCQQGVGRQNIEDCLFLRNRTNERYAILGIADGIGGLEMGETASAEVCKIFNAPIKEHPEQELAARAKKVNLTLYTRKEKQGATLSVVVIDKKDNRFFAISIGDSRIYKYSKLKLVQLSTDDNPLCTQFNLGNIVTNAIGLKKTIKNMSIILGEATRGDSWLLLTDGVHSFVGEGDIKETIQLFKKHRVVGELANQAINRGSEDDMAAIFCIIK